MQPLQILEKSTFIYFDHVTLLIEPLCVSKRVSPSRIYEVGTYLMGKFFVLILLIHGRSLLAYNMAYIVKITQPWLENRLLWSPRTFNITFFGLKLKLRTLSKCYITKNLHKSPPISQDKVKCPKIFDFTKWKFAIFCPKCDGWHKHGIFGACFEPREKFEQKSANFSGQGEMSKNSWFY